MARNRAPKADPPGPFEKPDPVQPHACFRTIADVMAALVDFLGAFPGATSASIVITFDRGPGLPSKVAVIPILRAPPEPAARPRRKEGRADGR